MPKYCYQCEECNHGFEIRHSIRDRLYDCPECNRAESLARIPQIENKNIQHAPRNEKIGDKVKEYIEINKQILKEQQREFIEDPLK